MQPRSHTRTARLAAAAAAISLALPPASAAAQRIVFPPLEWGLPADSVRPRMEALGWWFLHANPQGDMWMTDGELTLTVVSGERGLVEVLVEHPVAPEGVAARHTAVVDSLRGALGAPLGSSDGWTVWERGFAAVGARVVAGSGEEPSRVLLRFMGPGAQEEELRRRRLAPPEDPFPTLDAGWAVFRLSPQMRVSVDTASVRAQGRGVHRARIRLDFYRVTEDPSGNYDALIYGSDFDCEGRRVQMRSRTALLRGRQVRTDSGATVWVPARAGTPEGVQADVVCGYVAERATPAP